MRVLNKNKKKVTRNHRKIIKEMYFNNISSGEVAEKLGYKVFAIDKYYNSSATTYYKENGIEYKRCTICKVYRKINEYGVLNTKKARPTCYICTRQISRNKYKIRKNEGKEPYSNYSWGKYRWKYLVQRSVKGKIKRILLKTKQGKKT